MMPVVVQAAHESDDEGRDVLAARERCPQCNNNGVGMVEAVEAIRRRYISMTRRDPSTVMEAVEIDAAKIPDNLIPMLSLNDETEPEIQEGTGLAAVDRESCQLSSHRTSLRDRAKRYRSRTTSASTEVKGTQTEPKVERKSCECKTKPAPEMTMTPHDPAAKVKHWCRARDVETEPFVKEFLQNRELREDRYNLLMLRLSKLEETRSESRKQE